MGLRLPGTEYGLLLSGYSETDLAGSAESRAAGSPALPSSLGSQPEKSGSNVTLMPQSS